MTFKFPVCSMISNEYNACLERHLNVLFACHGSLSQNLIEQVTLNSNFNFFLFSLAALVGSTAENEHADGIDWQQEIYDKVI